MSSEFLLCFPETLCISLTMLSTFILPLSVTGLLMTVLSWAGRLLMPGFGLIYCCISNTCLPSNAWHISDAQQIFFLFFLGWIFFFFKSPLPVTKWRNKSSKENSTNYLNLVNDKGISSLLPILFNQNSERENCSYLWYWTRILLCFGYYAWLLVPFCRKLAKILPGWNL